ncbi:MAG: MarR family transcriptional regulator [Firmicutes bacterium]|nr:MarR family transcriptional regulator [Bacillota bacterium]
MQDIKDLLNQFLSATFRFKSIISGHIKKQGDLSEVRVLTEIDEYNLRQTTEISCMDYVKAQLCLTKSAISQALKNLEGKGFVVREYDKADRRILNIALTQQGKQFLSELKEKAGKFFANVMLEFGTQKTELLIEHLNCLSDVFQKVVKDESRNDEPKAN